MGGFTVTASELRAAQGFLSDTAGDLSREINVVADDVSDLLTSWTGGAATAFGKGWQQWHTGIDEVLDGLGRMATLLAASADTYQHTDGSVSLVMGTAGEDL